MIKIKLMLENLCLKSSIHRDLMLLQNQLPFFFLESLYDLGFSNHPAQNNPSFLQLACNYFKEYNPQKKSIEKIKHLTDSVRLFHLPSHLFHLPSYHLSRPTTDTKEVKITNLHSASELHEAGVRFKMIDSDCLLDVSFNKKKCVIQIPQIVFEDPTESVIQNLMALKQCHYPDETHICDYITLLDYIIDTTEDVD